MFSYLELLFKIGYNHDIIYLETHFVLRKNDVLATTIPKNSIQLPKDAKNILDGSPIET